MTLPLEEIEAKARAARLLNEIPAMVDPLGRYWNQPRDIRSAPIDETHVILTEAQISALAKYDSSLPTGVYPGKCWMRSEPSRELLVWYGAETPEHTCPILFREILRAQS